MSSVFVLSVLYLTGLATAQAPPIPPAAACIPGSPGCQDPYPPGTQSIGDSWWSIGEKYQGFISNLTIKRVSTFLDLPEPPQDSPGLIILNTALDNSNTELGSIPHGEAVESIAGAFPMDACNQERSQWCMFVSYYFHSTGADDDLDSSFVRTCEMAERPVKVDAGTRVQITYEYAGVFEKKLWRQLNQTVSIPDYNGKDLTLFSKSRLITVPPQRFWPRTECLCQAKGTIPQYSYSQTNITLAAPVTSFNLTVQQNYTYSSPIYTSDDGTTWHIDKLTLTQSWCDNSSPCTRNQNDTIDPNTPLSEVPRTCGGTANISPA